MCVCCSHLARRPDGAIGDGVRRKKNQFRLAVPRREREIDKRSTSTSALAQQHQVLLYFLSLPHFIAFDSLPTSSRLFSSPPPVSRCKVVDYNSARTILERERENKRKGTQKFRDMYKNRRRGDFPVSAAERSRPRRRRRVEGKSIEKRAARTQAHTESAAPETTTIELCKFHANQQRRSSSRATLHPSL